MPSLSLPPLKAHADLGFYCLRHRNALASHTKYLQFLKFLHTPRYLKHMVGNILDVWILASVARNHGRPHIHLVPVLLYQDFLDKNIPDGLRVRRVAHQGRDQRSREPELSAPEPRPDYLRARRTGGRRPSHRRASGSASSTHRRRSRSTGRNGSRADCATPCRRSRCTSCCRSSSP